jgi:diguanylate cyclase
MPKIASGLTMKPEMKALPEGSNRPSSAAMPNVGAFGVLHQWGLAPNPKSYELAYLYLNEADKRLRADIAQLVGADMKLSPDAIGALRIKHIPEEANGQRSEKIGDALSGELKQAGKVIDTALGITYRAEAVHEAVTEFGPKIDRDSLREIVAFLATDCHARGRDLAAVSKDLRALRARIAGLEAELHAIRTSRLLDVTTGLPNGRSIRCALADVLAQTAQAKSRVALILIDIDSFGPFGEKHGPEIRAQVLRLVAHTLKEIVANRGFVARYKGDRFAIMIEKSDLGSEFGIAENIRQTISKSQIVNRVKAERIGRITISAGMAALNSGADSKSLIGAAEQSLRQAKQGGGNCVVSIEAVRQERPKQLDARSAAIGP